MAKVTGLSGNEIYCLSLKNYTAGELVVGNSVNSMGFLGGMAAGFKGIAGGEITQVTQAIEEGRINDCIARDTTCARQGEIQERPVFRARYRIDAGKHALHGGGHSLRYDE